MDPALETLDGSQTVGIDRAPDLFYEGNRAAVLAARLRSAAFAATVFAGSFLLFVIEPLVTKRILPWFGGGPAVWTVCFVFFQAALLAGYATCHWVMRQTRPVQAAFYAVAIAATCLSLPVEPARWWNQPVMDPTLSIFRLLTLTIGPTFLLLSCSGPLLQAWKPVISAEASPWYLFALSNLGSLAGLLSYPLLIESRLGLRDQIRYWSTGYGVWAVAAMILAADRYSRMKTEPDACKNVAGPAFGLRCMWVLLSACPSALLLALTGHLTQNVAPAPLLWIPPLALYLLSFILCFEGRGWYVRKLFGTAAGIGFGVAAVLIDDRSISAGIGADIAIWCGIGFILFMVCHGELAGLRPVAGNLTTFYLSLALGGALGGAFVSLAAPVVFRSLFELPVVLSVTAAALTALFCTQGIGRTTGAAFVAAATLYASFLLATDPVAGPKDGWVIHERTRARNFYGALSVSDREAPTGSVRILRHGTVVHGMQLQAPLDSRTPTTYFGTHSGVGLAITRLQERGPIRVGVVGLGAGVLATYGRAGDSYRLYEIDPLAIRIANSEFSFLRDCLADVAIVQGDARLSLAGESPKGFDLLVVDAFSGDSIPVQLLTIEAFRIYARHLAPRGVVAVHVSNQFLALEPVVSRSGFQTIGESRRVHDDAVDRPFDLASTWVLISSDPGFFDDPRLISASAPVPPMPGPQAWTDDFSDLYHVVRR